MRLTFPRLWRFRDRSGGTSSPPEQTTRESQLHELGQLLRARREAEGLSLRALAQDTRITTPVIEALERGWADRLPERAYLASMLPQLERRLSLSPGTLDGVLPPAVARHRTVNVSQRRFTPGNIDVFTTWQGTVVYAAVIGLSLLMINRQQQDLAIRNSQSLEPVRVDLQGLRQAEAIPSSEPQIRALRPLEQALQRQPQDWLKAAGGVPVSQPGILSLTLTQARQLRVSSGGGERLQLEATAGRLTLQLEAPVEVAIQPTPTNADEVLWNGQELKPLKTQPGVYRVEATRALAPPTERPQTAPRSP
ncbi:MAG: helix-turn-helix transcriptional regulator [Cyanobacteria bacterium]|nr:helix-turn-helix transcriptional regulator [Cyanobacteriota bacterium]